MFMCFYTLSHPFICFIRLFMLSYAFISFPILSYTLFYAFICFSYAFHMLSYAFHTLSYTFIRFWYAFVCIQTQKSKTSLSSSATYTILRLSRCAAGKNSAHKTQYTCVTNAFVQESFRREAPEMLNLVLISLFYYHYMFWWRNSRHFLIFLALKNNYTHVVLEAESFAFRSAFRARDVPK